MSTSRAYVKVARAEAEERTRIALLDAAEAAFFSERSWDDVPLTGLADAAGVTKQTLLRHFGSKDGLLLAAHERAYERVRAQRSQAPTDDIAGAVDNLLDHYAEHGRRALHLGAMDRPGPLGTVVARARQLHYDWVDATFGAWLARFRARERARRRAAVIALCDVHTWNLLSADLGLDRADVHATLTTTITRLLEDDR